MRLLVGLAALTLVLGACGGDDDATSGDEVGAETSPNAEATDGDTGQDLRPADEVIAEEEASASMDGEIGEDIDLGEGLTVTVQAMRAGGDDLGPWLEVDVRAENRGEEELTNPELAIVCDGGAETGGWQADSTFDLGDELPAGSFHEGTVHLLLPEDGRYGEPVPECGSPAYVRISPYATVVVDGQEPPAADVEIPVDILEQLNSARLTG